MTIHAMKRSGGAVWLAAAAAVAMVVGGMLGVPADAQAATDTATVCSDGCDYTSIQEAIDDSSGGATIEVGAGTYRENVSASNVTLVGAGAEVTKIVASSANTRPLTLGSNATVRGF